MRIKTRKRIREYFTTEQIKTMLVAGHRKGMETGDWSDAVKASQAKEWKKRTKLGRCEVCDVPVHGRFCRMHAIVRQFYSHAVGVLVGAAVLLTASAFAQLPSVTFEWDASLSTNPITVYKVWWGPASRMYTNNISVGTNLTGTVSNLLQGPIYFFAATATDNRNVQSDFSNEVLWNFVSFPSGLSCVASSPPGVNPPWVQLVWNTVTGATNYTLYWGGWPGPYTNSIKSVTTVATISNLVSGGSYTIAVSATDGIGVESQKSGPVMWTVYVPPPGPTNLRAKSWKF